MKKSLIGVLLLTAMLILCLGGAAADTLVPQEVLEALPTDCTVFEAADGSTLAGKDACWFVLAREKNGTNALYHFTLKDGHWKQDFRTASAVPQTGHDLSLFLSFSGYEWPTDEPYNVPMLSVEQLDAETEYPELCVTFELENGKWLLHRVCTGPMQSLSGSPA